MSNFDFIVLNKKNENGASGNKCACTSINIKKNVQKNKNAFEYLFAHFAHYVHKSACLVHFYANYSLRELELSHSFVDWLHAWRTFSISF